LTWRKRTGVRTATEQAGALEDPALAIITGERKRILWCITSSLPPGFRSLALSARDLATQKQSQDSKKERKATVRAHKS